MSKGKKAAGFVLACLSAFCFAFAVACGEDEWTSEDIISVSEFESESGSASVSPVVYTVTFEADGKTTTSSVEENNTVTRPADPVKDGNVFVGWYTDKNYSEKYYFETPVTGDFDLYARFVEYEGGDEYVVTFYDGETAT